MKKLAAVLIILLCFACGRDTAEKPERLLSEDEMVAILYDLSLLQTISSSNPRQIQENGVDVKNYIYKKYNIDSLTLVQNQKYYASDVEKYQILHNKVLDRLKKEKAPLDSVPANKVKSLRNKPKIPVRE